MGKTKISGLNVDLMKNNVERISVASVRQV